MRPELVVLEDREQPPALPREVWTEGTETVSGAAEFLKCSRKHVFKLMKSGELPWGRFGRRGRRIPKRALVDYVAHVVRP